METAESTVRPQIVFFGSGPVAAKSLQLLSEYCDVEAVITKPQPPHHKEKFPVLELAEKMGTQIFTPYGKKELSELFAKNPVASKIGIVIDYGFIINQDVIDYFPLGIINSHFSVLPDLRGADPISFAILSGQKMTGVSLMRITAGMDEGPLLGYGEWPLDGTETTPELTHRLITLSDTLLKKELPRYIADPSMRLADQSITGRKVSYSRKLTKEDGVLDFSKSAEQLEREVRAFIEWPRSRIVLGDTQFIVTKSHVEHKNDTKTGTIWLEYHKFGVFCSKDSLVIDRIIPPGKKEMTAEAFLAGYRHLLP